MSYKKKIFYIVIGQIFSVAGVAMMIQANIGYDPWNVLHAGISMVSGMQLGTASILVAAAAIVIAAALGERFGFGTVVSVFVPGLLINVVLANGWIPLMQTVWSGLLMMTAGQAVFSVGTYFYLMPQMGAGPRDALMVALSRTVKLPVGVCRTAMEIFCVGAGWLMGGQVGIGTVFAALTIGFFLQGTFAIFRYNPVDNRQETFADTLRALRRPKSKA